MRGSSTTVSRCDCGLGGAEQAGGALHGVVGGLVDVELVGADGRPRRRSRSASRRPAEASACTVEPARVSARDATADAGAGGDRRLADAVAVRSRLARRVMRGSPAEVPASSSMRELDLVGRWGQRRARRGQRSRSAASTPSGSARPRNSSGVPNCALSRASARAPRRARPRRACPRRRSPSRWSTITRTPTPGDSADVSDSTSPS